MFEFYDFKFPIYLTFIVLSLLVSYIIIYILLKKSNYPKEHIFLSILLSTLCTIIGSKIFTIIFNFYKPINILTTGFSSYGGAIGFIISVLIFTKITDFDKDNFKKTFFMGIPLIYSISKLGCFFVGCCYGIPYNGLFSVIYHNSISPSGALLPIQLIETICFFIIFIFYFVLYKKKNPYVIEIAIIFSALAKCLLDFFRYSHINKVISLNQIISIVFIILAIISIIKKRKKMIPEK